MEAVTEVGVENILLSDRESTPGSLPGLELEGYNTGINIYILYKIELIVYPLVVKGS